MEYTTSSSKTWIPLGRRHEQGMSLIDAYTEFFEALSWSPNHTPIPVVDTIVFGRHSTVYYSYDWPQQRVMPLTHLSTPNAALKSFMSMDEGNSIAAVWLSEVKDNKGYVISAEYLSLQGLSMFFQTGDTKKLGVLQRYVYPRPFRHVDEVAQEILVQYNHGKPISVERRLGNRSLDSQTEHPSVKGNLFVPIQTVGKMMCRGYPFSSQDCRYGMQGERITQPEFVQLCDKACTHVTSALMHYRRTMFEQMASGRNSPERSRGGVRPVSTMMLQLRQNFHDSQLYLISILALRHPADRYHVDVQYEFVKVPQEGTTFITTPLSQGELEITPLTSQQLHSYAMPSAQRKSEAGDAGAGAAEGGVAEDGQEDEYDEDDPNQFSPHRRPYDPELFACPNCDTIQKKEDFVRLEFREVLEHYLKQCGREHQAAVRVVRPPTAADVYGPSGRPKSARARPSTAGTVRPQSAKSVASTSQPQAAAAALLVTAASDAARVPPVLSRLNIPVAELANHPVRLMRTTPLCRECAESFGVATVGNERHPSPPRAQSPHDRLAADIKRRISQAPPTCLRSEVIDQMVVTSLQEHHRWIRQAERLKYEHKIYDEQSKIQTERDAQKETHKLSEEDELDMLFSGFEVRDTIQARASNTSPENSTAPPLVPQQSPSEKRVEICVSVPTAAAPLSSPATLVTSPQQASQHAPQDNATASSPQTQSEAPPKATDSTIEVLSTGPDMPLHIILQNDLYYKMELLLNGTDISDGVSMTSTSSLLKPLPRPAVVLTAEDIDVPIVQYRKKTLASTRKGRKEFVTAMKRSSTTFGDLSNEERLLLVGIIGGDPNRILSAQDEGMQD